MNSIEISVAPHKFNQMQVTEVDLSGRPTRVDYYWRGRIVFHLVMGWDENGWNVSKKIYDDKESANNEFANV